MGEAKFTRGDWYCEFGGAYARVRIDGKIVADLRTLNATYNKHDAWLIAVAPEMYNYISHMIDHNMINDHSVERELTSLLTKARGELTP